MHNVPQTLFSCLGNTYKNIHYLHVLMFPLDLQQAYSCKHQSKRQGKVKSMPNISKEKLAASNGTQSRNVLHTVQMLYYLPIKAVPLCRLNHEMLCKGNGISLLLHRVTLTHDHHTHEQLNMSQASYIIQECVGVL